MSELLDSWDCIIIDFFENQVSQSALYKAREYITEKSKELKDEKSQQKISKLEKAIEDKQNELDNLRIAAHSGEVRDWIDKTSEKKIKSGRKIIKTTHVLKFTHGAASNAGVLIDNIEAENLLTTATLGKNRAYDLAHNNGNLITISRFLALSLMGKSIFDCIMEGNFEFLDSFYGSQEQLVKWKDGLANLIESRNIKTAEFAKQSYFPVRADKFDYHILVPLFSSSVAEALYRRVSDSIFDAEQVKIREQIRVDKGEHSKYAKGVDIRFPNIAVAKFGGAQPQNISMLNKGRNWKASQTDNSAYGIGYLFNCAPPTWRSQLKPPVKNKSLFDEASINCQAKTDIDFLREFLLRFERIELSIKPPERMKWIEDWVGNIIDEVFYYVYSIHQLPAGWSSEANIKLKIEHQYLLDPYRDNETFQADRQVVSWQSVICSDFAKWLNRALVGKDKQFTPREMHTHLWHKLFEDAFREFNNTIELDRKNLMEVDA